ncbi:hypothetical protein BU17DRAFT_102914 [Hysterangium stoloniferum]|nr:hypothetical protein BU17DRAFT_102914 [Hysterangium stoloniferum]
MHNLIRFCWGDQRARREDANESLEELFATVQSRCPNLKELQIDHLESQFMIRSRFDFVCSPIWRIVNLTKFSFFLRHESFDQKQVDMVGYLTTQCPGLRDLSIRVPGQRRIHIPQLIKEGYWPELRRLTLDGVLKLFDDCLDAKTQSVLLSGFLNRHNQLRCLHLGVYHDSSILPSTKLVHFRSLSLTRGSLTTFLPASLTPQFYFLSRIDINDGRSDGLLEKALMLKYITLYYPSRDALTKLLHLQPRIERIYFYSRRGNLKRTREEIFSLNSPASPT